MKYFKVIALSISLVLISLLASMGVANAQSFRAGDSIIVAKTDTVNSMLFAGGKNVDVAGKVNGDVYCAGSNVTISGTVTGDVICAGQNVTISGRVDGDIRVAGQTVSVTGSITGSASIGAQTLTIDSNGSIGKDLMGGAQTASINGKITRDATIGANDLAINGSVGRDVRGEINSVTVGSSGSVGGNLDYTGKNDPSISTGGKVVGSVTRHSPREGQAINQTDVARAAIGFLFYSMLAMLVLGIAIAWLMPGVVEESAATAMRRPGLTLLIGAAASLLAPMAIFLLFVTIVGVPLAIIAILLWIVVVILSTPFAAYLLAKTLLKNMRSPIGLMSAGIILLTILYVIPIINIFAIIGAYLFGVGMILGQSRKLYYKPSNVVKNKETSASNNK